MTFGAEDEQAYTLRRDELAGRFAEWARHERPEAAAADVALLLDWKWGYGDGRLDRWRPTDVEEFLLGWCPRKVAAPPDLVESIPHSVGAYVDFLAQEGLLAPGCSPSAVQGSCADLGPRFHHAMADATSLFGQLTDEVGEPDRAPADGEAATAEALVDGMLLRDEAAATADLAAWAAAHPTGAAALAAAATRADLRGGDVLSLLEMAGSVVGTDVERAAEAHRDGPHGPLVTMWLLLRGAIAPQSVGPDQMLVGTIEMAAAMMDDAGPAGVVEFFGADVEQAVDVLDHLWRAGHERTVEVLDALARHHPDPEIAEAARRSLMKARGRI